MSDGKRTEGHYLTVSESSTFLKVISKAMQISLKKNLIIHPISIVEIKQK